MPIRKNEQVHKLELMPIRKNEQVHKLDLMPRIPAIVATFRSGCILKGKLLEPMAEAYRQEPGLSNLLCAFPEDVKTGLFKFRECVGTLAMLPEVRVVVWCAGSASAVR